MSFLNPVPVSAVPVPASIPVPNFLGNTAVISPVIAAPLVPVAFVPAALSSLSSTSRSSA